MASMQRFVRGVASHWGIKSTAVLVDADELVTTRRVQPSLAAARLTAATGNTPHSPPLSRTRRRRQLRYQHKDRLAQSLFVVDLQITSLRNQLDEIRASEVERTKFFFGSSCCLSQH